MIGREVVEVATPKGPHPGVVLQRVADTGFVVVAVGTGTQRLELPAVTVDEFTRIGIALGLTKRTYFYVVYVCLVREEELRPWRATRPGAFRTAPLALFIQLRTAMEMRVQELLNSAQPGVAQVRSET